MLMIAVIFLYSWKISEQIFDGENVIWETIVGQ